MISRTDDGSLQLSDISDIILALDSKASISTKNDDNGCAYFLVKTSSSYDFDGFEQALKENHLDYSYLGPAFFPSSRSDSEISVVKTYEVGGFARVSFENS